MFIKTICFLCILNMSLSHKSNLNDSIGDEEVYIVPRVVNGYAAKLGDVPYQVAFKNPIRRSRNKYATFCGGVIISNAKLLSAAHCFADENNVCEKMFGCGQVSRKSISPTYAVAGNLHNYAVYHKHTGAGDGQWRRLKRVIYPPKYKFPKLDIAIVFLITPFVFNSNVNSIPYASKFVDYSGKCLVSGYGRISSKASSDKLLLAHLTLIPWKPCNRMHRRNMRMFVCTSSEITDVGKGDSGGPLVCANTGDPNESGKGVLVGIVSGHRYRVGSFFTRVSSFHKYIERNKTCESEVSVLAFVLVNLIQWMFSLFSFGFIFNVMLVLHVRY